MSTADRSSRRIPTLLIVVAAGLCTRLYSGPGSALVRGSLGGLFYVLFWCLLGFFLFPGACPRAVALSVFASTCAIEFMQLWHPPLLEAARNTVAGRLLLGSVFSWGDFPWYVAGCAAAWLAGRALRERVPEQHAPIN